MNLKIRKSNAAKSELLLTNTRSLCDFGGRFANSSSSYIEKTKTLTANAQKGSLSASLLTRFLRVSSKANSAFVFRAVVERGKLAAFGTFESDFAEPDSCNSLTLTDFGGASGCETCESCSFRLRHTRQKSQHSRCLQSTSERKISHRTNSRIRTFSSLLFRPSASVFRSVRSYIHRQPLLSFRHKLLHEIGLRNA